jgi:hypothetical protein
VLFRSPRVLDTVGVYLSGATNGVRSTIRFVSWVKLIAPVVVKIQPA